MRYEFIGDAATDQAAIIRANQAIRNKQIMDARAAGVKVPEIKPEKFIPLIDTGKKIVSKLVTPTVSKAAFPIVPVVLVAGVVLFFVLKKRKGKIS